jgi:putative ABC transport system permease protein
MKGSTDIVLRIGGGAMPFALLVFRNLIRQKIRTGLTVLGITIGITAVVALGIITESAKASTVELLRAGGSDFAVGRHGSADLTLSVVTADDLEKVRGYDEVEHASGVLLAFSRVGSNPFFAQLGIDPADLDFFDLPVSEGRRLAPGAKDEIMLGPEAAKQLDAGVGDMVEVREQTLRVVGIYRTGTVYLDGGAVLPISTVWEYERKEGLYTLVYVRAQEGADLEALTARIEAEHPDLATLRGLEDVGDVDQGIEIIDAVNLGITILAIFIGGIAVMNTMVMAVFERTREIGILRAVGWRTRRILQMILGEALLLCMVGAVFGSALAVLLTRFITLFPTIRAFISPEYTPEVFIRGIIVGVSVAVLGAIYPAFRAARFSPAEAIRYE